jgi:hypothetical protein
MTLSLLYRRFSKERFHAGYVVGIWHTPIYYLVIANPAYRFACCMLL